MLQEPSMPSPGQLMSLPPPQNKNKWVHPVIFEPQPMIQLIRSSYKVTSFLDFQLFLDGFKAIYCYVENLKLVLITLNTFKDLCIKMHQSKSLHCQMKPLSTNISAQDHVNSTSSLVLQNLKLNSINWRFNTLIKYFMLLIENFLQP